MTIQCSAKPCPIVLSAECVHYEGASLVYSGIHTNDTLEVALQKIDVLIKNDSASGIMTTHEATYNHSLISTALQSETDPIFSQWLIATPPAYISDIPTNVSELTNDEGYITVADIPAETDPVFSVWDKSTGISITESQISDLQAYLLSISGEDLSTTGAVKWLYYIGSTSAILRRLMLF